MKLFASNTNEEPIVFLDCDQFTVEFSLEEFSCWLSSLQEFQHDINAFLKEKPNFEKKQYEPWVYHQSRDALPAFREGDSDLVICVDLRNDTPDNR